ncbi:hypothetical protein [Streptomyces sp. NPDC049040]|uniref:hypothetical protein n=1 Tax=Streptomyces sp. NPDC049040 TaxID=3365593 RepID=UPI00371D91C0
MFDFGIAGYRPAWLDRRSDIVQEHGQRLRGLAGRTLTRVWTVWDLRNDKWFCDCPVLFDFDGKQVEINHHRLNDLSLTWNTIDPTFPVRWPGFDLQWCPEPFPGLQALRGLPLKAAELLEWTDRDVAQGNAGIPELLEWTGGDVAQGNAGISFAFETGRVTVFNALDENGVSFDPPSPSQRSHSLH